MPGTHAHYRYLRDPLEYAQKSATSAQLSHRIKFYKMDSKELGRKFDELINEPIDLLYIDGDHSVEGCLSDFVLFYPYVPVGGYIVLHDIYPEECGYYGPRYVIDNLIKNSSNFELVEIKTTAGKYGGNYGMALIRKLGTQSVWTKQQQRAISFMSARSVGTALLYRLGRELGMNLKNPTAGVKQSWRTFLEARKLGKDKNLNDV